MPDAGSVRNPNGPAEGVNPDTGLPITKLGSPADGVTPTALGGVVETPANTDTTGLN